MRAHPDYPVRPRGHRVHEPRRWTPHETDRAHRHDAEPGCDADEMADRYETLAYPYGRLGQAYDHVGGHAHALHERTQEFVNRGRRNAYRRGLPRWQLIAVLVAIAAVGVTILMVATSGGGPSWPSSVAAVRTEADRACQNPDVVSEPAQVNFACARATRQILWVFALMLSGDDPRFADARTGRMGLEPITPTQGGEVAWSLNLHHPYDPTNPIDSLEVAARAINNIIGGATLTGANGTPSVQAGLESYPANCLRYTGSAALAARRGFPSLCASPVATPAGQAALVADAYLKWDLGAGPQAAQDAAVLFENAGNPGDSQVQAILRTLPGARSGA